MFCVILCIVHTRDSNLFSVPHVFMCFGSHSFAVTTLAIRNTFHLHIHNLSVLLFSFNGNSKHFPTTYL